jgi:hypothetical protein
LRLNGDFPFGPWDIIFSAAVHPILMDILPLSAKCAGWPADKQLSKIR